LSDDKKLELWRISNFADLSGTGGVLAGARWHTKGQPVVYMAENPPGALLETLVHLEIDVEDMPSKYQLLKVTMPSTVSQEICPPLADGWQRDEQATRAVGDNWLREQNSLLLKIPSAIVPFTSNYLFNPLHEDASLAEIEVGSFPLDERLLKL
jgi:RES domain-containing protein